MVILKFFKSQVLFLLCVKHKVQSQYLGFSLLGMGESPLPVENLLISPTRKNPSIRLPPSQLSSPNNG